MMRRSSRIIFLALLAALVCCTSRDARAAGLSAPFPSRHLNPIVQAFGLPPAETAELLPPGGVSTRLLLEGANSFSLDDAPDERLILDGEVYRATLAVRVALFRRMELGVDLPYVEHRGGEFDSVIEDFHDIFGISDAERESVERDRLTYLYERNGRRIIDIRDRVSGIGDVMVHGLVQLSGRQEQAARHLALRLSLKFPTGEASKLTGSGSTDVALQLIGEDHGLLDSGRLAFFGGIGALLMGDADLLADQQRDVAEFGFFGFGWQALPWLAFKLQMDVHTSFFKESDFKPIDSWSAQVLAGFSFSLPHETSFDLAVSEGAFVETAPDAALHLSLKKTF